MHWLLCQPWHSSQPTLALSWMRRLLRFCMRLWQPTSQRWSSAVQQPFSQCRCCAHAVCPNGSGPHKAELLHAKTLHWQSICLMADHERWHWLHCWPQQRSQCVRSCSAMRQRFCQCALLL